MESRRTASPGTCTEGWGAGGGGQVGPCPFRFKQRELERRAHPPRGDKGPDGWFHPPGSEAQLGASPRFVRLQPARELGTQTQPSRNYPRGQQFAKYTGISFPTKPKRATLVTDSGVII